MAGIDNLKSFKQGYDERRGSKPKGAIHLSTMIQRMLNEDIEPEDPKGKPKKQIQALVEVALTKSRAGDNKWAEWLAKYGYGQKFELEHSGEVTTGIKDDKLAAEFSEFLKNQTKQ